MHCANIVFVKLQAKIRRFNPQVQAYILWDKILTESLKQELDLGQTFLYLLNFKHNCFCYIARDYTN